MGRVISDPATRKAVYSVMTALVPILVGAGVISDTDAGKWLAVITAMGGALTTIVAALNVAPHDAHADNSDGVADNATASIEVIPASEATSGTMSDAAGL